MYVCRKIYIRCALNKVTDALRSQTKKNVFNVRLKHSVDRSTECTVEKIFSKTIRQQYKILATHIAYMA